MKLPSVVLPEPNERRTMDKDYHLERDSDYNIVFREGHMFLQLVDEDGIPYELIPIPEHPDKKKAIDNAKRKKQAEQGGP